MKIAGSLPHLIVQPAASESQDLTGDHVAVRHGFQYIGLIGLKKSGLCRPLVPPSHISLCPLRVVYHALLSPILAGAENLPDQCSHMAFHLTEHS